eukprot:4937634-Alexandrium_andersonii.AAC.1
MAAKRPRPPRWPVLGRRSPQAAASAVAGRGTVPFPRSVLLRALGGRLWRPAGRRPRSRRRRGRRR